jgi:hypothetical protein
MVIRAPDAVGRCFVQTPVSWILIIRTTVGVTAVWRINFATVVQVRCLALRDGRWSAIRCRCLLGTGDGRIRPG